MTWTLPFSLELPFPISLELLLIAGRAIALVGALLVFAWAFARWRKAQVRDMQRIFEQLDLIQGELHGHAEILTVLAGRLEQLEEKVVLDNRLAPAQIFPIQRGYENAIRLAQRGVSVDELVANCALARHEAELLVRLHGKVNSSTETKDSGQWTAVDATSAGSKRRLAAVG